MPIVYDKLLELLRERGFTTYKLQKGSLIPNTTYTAMKNHTGGPSHLVLERICDELRVQPGEIMEWIPPEEAEE